MFPFEDVYKCSAWTVMPMTIYFYTPRQINLGYHCKFQRSLLTIPQALSFKNACCAKNSKSQVIQVCCRCARCVQLCIVLSDFDVLKIALLKTILGV